MAFLFKMCNAASNVADKRDSVVVVPQAYEAAEEETYEQPVNYGSPVDVMALPVEKIEVQERHTQQVFAEILDDHAPKVLIGTPRSKRTIQHDLSMGDLHMEHPGRYVHDKDDHEARADHLRREIQNHQHFSKERALINATPDLNEDTRVSGGWDVKHCARGAKKCTKDDHPLTKIGHHTRGDQVNNHRQPIDCHDIDW